MTLKPQQIVDRATELVGLHRRIRSRNDLLKSQKAQVGLDNEADEDAILRLEWEITTGERYGWKSDAGRKEADLVESKSGQIVATRKMRPDEFQASLPLEQVRA